ncbi:YdeI/OmpD-associated family protein [Mumia sp. DW29H23]|uniref:YdeI/OmpD-associated family protein n=1 Tax=Mumia sp. DW29H23 TaxID=3421241 RepID=UPI003D687257
MKFRAEVEPPEPMKGLEVPPEIVASLDGGARPRVTVTINGHTWSTRIAIMRGRNLIGLSNANRTAAGVSVGEQVEVEVARDDVPLTVEEPEDLATALAADPAAQAAYDRLTVSQKRQHVRVIEAAKKPDTRARRVQKAIDDLRGTAR